MSIEGLVVNEAMRHIEDFGCVKNMEPMALHILKTSERPVVAAMRDWMRRAAVKQALKAEREQKKMSDQFANEPVRKGAPMRRCAVIHPWYAEQMMKQHKTSWNDKDFVHSVREANPKIFPTRTA